ncbi:protein RER1A-like protein [Carex littledalei]|uniref:Protein RER1 n=1 Tax=Carex littledalei TaxID=544730 RepID=A0A833VNJ2_9POAL|nr:protein RER1A-like protein [Carex littledalei]
MENPPAATAPAVAAAPVADDADPASRARELVVSFSRRYQHLLDRATPFVRKRWLGLGCLALLYLLRVWLVEGFYIVTYALGIYSLGQLVSFLSPMVDPEIQEFLDGSSPSLPTRSTDEYRPFVRRLPEFKFWYAVTRAFCIAFVMTFFSIFDVPVFWPILLFYFCTLTFVTMKRQIQHMIKYKYVPFSFGKQRYGRKKASATEDASLMKE